MRALTLAALIAGACARPLLIGYGAPSDKASVTLRGTGAGVNVTGTLTLVETPKGVLKGGEREVDASHPIPQATLLSLARSSA